MDDDLLEIRNFEELVLLQIRLQEGHDLLQFLRRNGLVRKVGKRCCGTRMQEQPNQRDKLIGHMWRCLKCRTTQGLTANSFFGGTRMDPWVVIKMAFLYVVQKTNEKQFMTSMANSPSTKTIYDWVQFFRDVMAKDLMFELHAKKMGGPGKVIILDETEMFVDSKAKDSDGQHPQYWAQGIYDMDGKVGILEFVEHKSQENLIKRIKSHVEPGSIVISECDEHQSYPGLEGFNFTAFSHSDANVVPGRMCRNHIKGYFSRMKTFLRRRYAKSRTCVPSYLDEFMWSERHGASPWADFWKAVQRQYRV